MKKIDKKIVTIIVSILIILDQLSKVVIVLIKDKLPIIVINKFFMLSYVENSGAAFGIKVGSVWTFILINIIVIGFIIAIFYSQISKLKNKEVIVFSLVLAGGISNLIDRIFRGAVIDFLDFTPVVNFPVFNFSDIMIVVSVFIFIILLIKNLIYKSDSIK